MESGNTSFHGTNLTEHGYTTLHFILSVSFLDFWYGWCTLVYMTFILIDLKQHLQMFFLPVWMIAHYFLYVVIFFVDVMYGRNIIQIETNPLQKLLKEVAVIDLTGDPTA